MRLIVRTPGFLLAAMATRMVRSLMGTTERPVAAQGHAPAAQAAKEDQAPSSDTGPELQDGPAAPKSKRLPWWRGRLW